MLAVAGCSGGDGDLDVFCSVVEDQWEALASGQPDDVLAGARAVADAAPDDLMEPARAYVAALEAEAEISGGDGLVDAVAVAESMEVIGAGRGAAADALSGTIRRECGVDDLDL